MEKIEREYVILNAHGLHARPASLLVQAVNPFKCEVTLEKDGVVVNAKSILGVMMLAAGQFQTIKLRATGPEAQKAAEAVEKLIKDKFNEE